MSSSVILTQFDHESFHSLQEELIKRGLRLATPPKGTDDIFCLSPVDNRFICFWTRGKAEYKNRPFPRGTKVAVESRTVDSSDLTQSRKPTPKKLKFTKEQVTALCGGSLPKETLFSWDEVEYFLLEDGALQPYSGEEILPGPGIRIQYALVA